MEKWENMNIFVYIVITVFANGLRFFSNLSPRDEMHEFTL